MISAPFVKRDRGQILPMVAGMAVVLIAMVGLAIDVGRMMVTKAQLVRAVDAAALAGALKLPDMTAAETEVYLYMAENEPEATVDVPSSPAERQVQVVAHKHVDLTFLRVLTIIPGIDLEDPVTVSAEAVAGFGVVTPVDVQLVMDDTGTMKNNCNPQQTDEDCAIKQARDGANTFVDTLLSDTGGEGGTQVGMNPFRGCYGSNRYNPVSGESADRGCVLFSEIVDLTSDPDPVHTAIDGLRADGGYPGTNICLALNEALEYLNGPNAQPGALRYLIILTDGDNRYSDGAQSNQRGNNPHPSGAHAPPVYPPPQWPSSGSTPTHRCRMTGPAQNSKDYGPDYDSRINALDDATYALAEETKAMGVEIYVIGYGVVGHPEESNCDPNQVGTGGNRDHGVADPQDRNLAKCISSSTEGTYDHYFEAPAPEDLPEIFQSIAANIAFRLIK